MKSTFQEKLMLFMCTCISNKKKQPFITDHIVNCRQHQRTKLSPFVSSAFP